MSFALYFGIGMAVLVVVVLAGFIGAQMHNTDYWTPTKQAERSGKKSLRDAQL